MLATALSYLNKSMKTYGRNIKKDYQSKNLRNPFFHKKAAGKGSRWLKWLVLLGLGLIAFIIWLLFGAHFWNISEINLTGLNRVPKSAVDEIIREEADQARFFFFSGHNIFLFDTEAACETLLNSFNLTGCSIERKLPGTLEVIGYERPYSFIWQEGSEYFYSSREGYIIRDQLVSDEDKQKYFILENKNPGSLIGHNNVINVKSDYLNFAFSLYERIADQNELALEKFVIDWEFNTLKAKFANGPEVFFNTRDDAVTQLNRLQLVKNEKIKDNFNRTEYIDLRYGDKIFINPDFK